MLTSLEIAHKIAEVYSPLSRYSAHALADVLVCRKYKKGQIILQQGETCHQMLFVEKGLVRQFYYKNDKEMTEHIGYEFGMIICIESYFKQEPTRLIVEALEAGDSVGVAQECHGTTVRGCARDSAPLPKGDGEFAHRIATEG